MAYKKNAYAQAMAKAKKKQNKYRNEPITDAYGNKFASKRELHRFNILERMEKAGDISNLKRQVRFELIPNHYNERGKVDAYSCSYVADFVYRDNSTGMLVVEDCKGFITDVYKIKKKLMLNRYGIYIKET